MKQRKIKHLATLAATLLVSVLLVSCGGGGVNTDGELDLTAVFTGDAPGDVGMAAGDSSGGDFDVQIMVSGIDYLASAAFRVYFDHTSAALVGWRGGADALFGANGDYRATMPAPGEVWASAAIRGTGAGVEDGTGLLITLRFRATAVTDGNEFNFGPDSDPHRELTTCDTAEQPCDAYDTSSWTGGTLMALE